jgi:hypothetical protein
MATNTAGTAARRDPRNVQNTLKLTVNFNDVGVSSGISFSNYLPQGAFITGVWVEVVTAFNAGTTNTLTVGTNATNYNNIVASGDGTGNGSSSLGTQVFTATRGQGRSLTASADVQVFAKYAQTGTAATTGQAIIVIEFEGGWTN